MVKEYKFIHNYEVANSGTDVDANLANDYDSACETMRNRNEDYLVLFRQQLVKDGLKETTIEHHISNVDFFINTYLLLSDASEMERGCFLVDDFLGYFFIRKCMWSTPASIKSNAASFKKFYKCMFENGHIAKESYDTLVATIKGEMHIWQEACAEFDNPSGSSSYDDLWL